MGRARRPRNFAVKRIGRACVHATGTPCPNFSTIPYPRPVYRGHGVVWESTYVGFVCSAEISLPRGTVLPRPSVSCPGDPKHTPRNGTPVAPPCHCSLFYASSTLLLCLGVREYLKHPGCWWRAERQARGFDTQVTVCVTRNAVSGDR